MASERHAGVYEIRNTLNNKVYIGSSANVNKRLGEHWRKLNRGTHGSLHLQAAWNKHGACNFAFKKLLACDAKDLMFYEQRLIDGYMAMDPEHGYNKRLVSQSNAGMKHSAETKRRVSAGMMGRVVSTETRAKISAANLGRTNTALSKLRMSAANKGRRLSVGQIERRGKLTITKVAEIRSLRSSTDATQLQLSAMFGVSRESIGEILRGETWKFAEAGCNKILSSKERKERNILSLPRGEAHHNFGKSWATEAAHKAASVANRHPMSEETKAKLSAAKKGKKMPHGFGEKMRSIRLGSSTSQRAKENLAAAKGKLDRTKALEIRRLHGSVALSHKEIAELFNVSHGCVRRILNNETWV